MEQLALPFKVMKRFKVGDFVRWSPEGLELFKSKFSMSGWTLNSKAEITCYGAWNSSVIKGGYNCCISDTVGTAGVFYVHDKYLLPWKE